jgi:hypothetical protein
MKLLGHTSPEMTMSYIEVALSDLRREFDLARSKPRHLVPHPKPPIASLRAGLDGVMDALPSVQHVLEMFRRALANGASRNCLNRPSNRLTRSSRKHANSLYPKMGRAWPLMPTIWTLKQVDSRGLCHDQPHAQFAAGAVCGNCCGSSRF